MPDCLFAKMHVSLDHRPLYQEHQRDDRQRDQSKNPKAIEEGLSIGLLVADQPDSAQAHQLATGWIAGHLGEEAAGTFQCVGRGSAQRLKAFGQPERMELQAALKHGCREANAHAQALVAKHVK